ncbi:NADH-cytochrome b5 reductase-like [Mactra antiquata]
MTEFPQKPERPLDSDCCGQGCDPCILDLYAEDLRIWEDECQRIRNGEDKKPIDPGLKQANGPVLSPTEYKMFIIESVSQETHNSYRFKLTLPHGQTLGLKTGQHVVIRGNVNGEILSRQYTPISDVCTRSQFELLIKIYEEGRMSQYVKQWNIGTMVEIRGPCGNFIYHPNKYKKVIMFTVGTGIAPMAQVIHTILNNEDDMTLIELLYGCRTYNDILMKAEIDEWSRYWNFTCTFYLSQEKESDSNYKYGDKIVKEHINKSIVYSVIDKPCDDIYVLICGTRTFEQNIIQYIKQRGLSDHHYHKF